MLPLGFFCFNVIDVPNETLYDKGEKSSARGKAGTQMEYEQFDRLSLIHIESVMTLLDRRMKAELAMFERALDKGRDYVDFIWTGEDLGTQRAPLISLDIDVYKRQHQGQRDQPLFGRDAGKHLPAAGDSAHPHRTSRTAWF